VSIIKTYGFHALRITIVPLGIAAGVIWISDTVKAPGGVRSIKTLRCLITSQESLLYAIDILFRQIFIYVFQDGHRFLDDFSYFVIPTLG